MHDINFFSQIQAARKVSKRSLILILTVFVVAALNVAIYLFLNSILSDKNLQLAQLNEYNNSAQSIQLLADAASESEENRIKQTYYNAALSLAQDIKKADMLTVERLDAILAAIPDQVNASAFSYAAGSLSFECTSPSDAVYLPRTIQALEDTGFLLSVNSEGISYINPAELDENAPAAEDGAPTEPYCSFNITCVFMEGGQ